MENDTDTDKLRRYFDDDPFTSSLGFRIDHADEREVKVSMVVTQNMLNRAGVIHGGVIFSLCDFAAAVLANRQGKTALTTDSNISYIKKGLGNTLHATASEMSRSKHITHIEVSASDDSGNILAKGIFTFYITEAEIQELCD